MAIPRTTYESSYPDDKYQGNTQEERTESGRLVANARDYNILDEEIQALQGFLGISTSSFDPTGPVPGSGETVINKITKIAGTANCLEQGAICNFGGATGIDPGGLILAKTTESGITDMVTPPPGWVQLSPPDPSGVYCPIFPTDPPWDPTPNPGFPSYPVPGSYPWPSVFDPDLATGFPVGPWMQFVQWAIGALQATWQTQNAQNIKLLPAGLINAGIPAPWGEWLRQDRLWPTTTSDMITGAGTSIPDLDTSGGASIFEATEHLIHHSKGFSEMFGAQWIVIDTGGAPGAFLDIAGAPGINTGATTLAENALAAAHLVIPSASDGTALPAVIGAQTSGGGADFSGTGNRAGAFRVIFDGVLPANTRIGFYFFYQLNTATGQLGPVFGTGNDRWAHGDVAVLSGGNTIATFTDGFKQDTRLMVSDAGVTLQLGVDFTIAGTIATATGIGTFTGPTLAWGEIADL